jgi:hypothetical protein
MKDFKTGDIVKINDINKRIFPYPKILIGIITFASSGKEKCVVNFPHDEKIKNTQFILSIIEIAHATKEERERFYAHEIASKL